MVHLDHLGHHTGECSCLAGDHTRDGMEVQIEDEVGVHMGAQLGDQREVPSLCGVCERDQLGVLWKCQHRVVGGIALEGLGKRHLKGSENKGIQCSVDLPLAGLYNMTVGKMGGSLWGAVDRRSLVSASRMK